MITPLGVGLEASWTGLLAGRSGIAAAHQLRGTRYAGRAAGEIPQFDPAIWIAPKRRRTMGRYSQLAVAAAHLAWRDAGIEISDGEALRAGCVLGVAAGGLPEIEAYKEALLDGRAKSVAYPLLPRMLPNQASGQVATALGLRGPVSCVSTACASGNNAIGTALHWIRCGDADLVVTGSTEACLSEICLADLDRMGVLSPETIRLDTACRPFDRARGGLVPAEGAGILVLEEEGRARRRGAHVYCELLGYGSSADAFHPVAPRRDGSGIATCIERALCDAHAIPERVAYVNAHGTGTVVGDEAETIGLKRAFGTHARRVAVSSTKSMLGHQLGGCGGVEAAIVALVVERGQIPPTINYETPDPVCDLDYVPNTARSVRVDLALSSAFGFGGTNAAIVVGRYAG